MRKPKQLTLAGLQLPKSASYVCPRFRIILARWLCPANRLWKVAATPPIPQEICRNPEKIAPAFRGIHFRQLGSQEAAVALLKQIIGNIWASGCPKKVGPQRTIRPAV